MLCMNPVSSAAKPQQPLGLSPSKAFDKLRAHGAPSMLALRSSCRFVLPFQEF